MGLSDAMKEFEKEKEKKPIDKNVFYIPFANQTLLIVLFVITYPLIGKKKEWSILKIILNSNLFLIKSVLNIIKNMKKYLFIT